MTQANIRVTSQPTRLDHTLLNFPAGKQYRITVYVDGRRQTGTLEWEQVNQLAQQHFSGNLSPLIGADSNQRPRKIVLAEPINDNASSVEIFRNLGDGLQLMQEQPDYAQEARAFMDGVLNLFRAQNGTDSKDNVPLTRNRSSVPGSNVQLQDAAIAQVDELNEELARLRIANSELTTSVERLTRLLESGERLSGVDDPRSVQAQEESQALAGQLVELQNKLNCVREALVNKDGDLASIRSQNQEAQREIAKLQLAIGRANAERESALCEQELIYREQIGTIQTELEWANSRVEELNREINNLKVALAEVTEKDQVQEEAHVQALTNAQGQVTRTCREAQRVKERLAAIQAEQSQLRTRNEQLAAQLTQASEKAGRVDELQLRADRAAVLGLELEAVKKAQDASADQLRVLKAAQEQANNRVEEANQKLAEATSIFEERLEAGQNDAKVKLRELQNELETAAWRQEELQRAQADETIARLRGELAAVKRARDEQTQALERSAQVRQEARLQELEATVAKKEDEIAQLRQAIKSVQAGAKRAQVGHRHERAELQRSHQEQQAASEAQIASLEKKYQEERAQRFECERQLKAIKPKMERLQRRLDDQVALEYGDERLQEERDEALARVKSQNVRLAGLEEKVGELTATVANLKDHNERLLTRQNSDAATIQRQGSEIGRLKHVDQSIEYFLKENERLCELRVQDALKAEKQKQALEAAHAKLPELQQQIEVLHKERDANLQLQLGREQQLSAQQETIDAQAAQLQKQLSWLARAKERIEADEATLERMSGLQDQLQESAKREADLQGKLDELREANQKVANLEQRLAALTWDRASTQEQNAQLRTQAAAAQVRVTELQQTHENELASLRAEVKGARAMATELTRVVERLRTANRVLEESAKRTAPLQKRLEQLTNRYDQLQSQHAQLAQFQAGNVRDLQTSQAEKAQLQAQVQELEEALKGVSVTVQVEKRKVEELTRAQAEQVEAFESQKRAVSAQVKKQFEKKVSYLEQRKKELKSQLQEIRTELKKTQWLRLQYWHTLHDPIVARRNEFLERSYEVAPEQTHFSLGPIERMRNGIERRVQRIGVKASGELEAASTIYDNLTKGREQLNLSLATAQARIEQMVDHRAAEKIQEAKLPKGKKQYEASAEEDNADLLPWAIEYVQGGTSRPVLKMKYEHKQAEIAAIIAQCDEDRRVFAKTWKQGQRRLGEIYKRLPAS